MNYINFNVNFVMGFCPEVLSSKYVIGLKCVGVRPTN